MVYNIDSIYIYHKIPQRLMTILLYHLNILVLRNDLKYNTVVYYY